MWPCRPFFMYVANCYSGFVKALIAILHVITPCAKKEV